MFLSMEQENLLNAYYDAITMRGDAALAGVFPGISDVWEHVAGLDQAGINAARGAIEGDTDAQR